MSAPAQAVATDRLWRAVLVLGVLATTAGLLAVVLALADGVGWVEPGIQTRVWWFHHANPLGGLLLALAGAVVLAGGWRCRPVLALVGAVALLVFAAAVPIGQAVRANVLGGSASTVALCLGLGGGVLACTLTVLATDRSAGTAPTTGR
jgi:hypothetical protein